MARLILGPRKPDRGAKGALRRGQGGQKLRPAPPTPFSLGYRMPAEWEPHEATWIAWPHEKTDWPGKFEPIPWVYGEFVRLVSRVERVRILVRDAAMEGAARRILKQSGAEMAAVEFFRVPTNRSWTRDFCPIFVRDAQGRVALTTWRFNAWAKYDNWKQDDAVNDFLARRLRLPQF